jgi:DNA-binding LacI/PurR family transcriptional regulator
MDYHTPFVFCDRSSPGIEIDSVSVDNYKAAYEATRYLAQNGHRNILHINIPLSIEHIKHREQGYIAAMKDNGLEPMVRYGTLTYESGYQMAKSIVKQLMPDAVFTANDMLALGVLKGLQEENIKIPEEVAIIGCDDIFASKISNPSLTTILQPAYQMGVKAFEMLHERLNGYNDKVRKVVLNHRLIVRESTEGKKQND